jgi:formiminoglutamase
MFGADFSALSITPAEGWRAPAVVRAALGRFSPWNAQAKVDLAAWHVADLGDAGAAQLAWDEAFGAITGLAGRALDAGAFVAALGGDHSVTWPLVRAAADRHERVGIVQLDVHHDVRSLDGGPSNGTPIRGLIEEGRIRGEDVVQIGIHPLANRRPLTEYCDEQGIHRVWLSDLARHGAYGAAADALQTLKRCDAIWLTVDIDVLDRAYAPGTVAALPGGITPTVLCQLVDAVCTDRRTIAVDVVEFDPSRDVSSITAYNVAHVLMTALTAVAQRSGGGSG